MEPRTAVYLCCVLLLLWTFSSTEAPSIATQTSESSNELTQIIPGSSINREIARGDKQEFEIGVGLNQLLRFSINKGDLLLSAAIYDPTGAKVFDYFSDDFEVVEISVPADVAGAYRIQIESHEKADNRRNYELKLELPTTVTVRDRKDNEARQALSQAEKLRASWLEAPLKQSLEAYDKAALIWISINDSLNASRATLKSAEVYFCLSKYSDALKRAQNAVALARKAGEAIAESQAMS